MTTKSSRTLGILISMGRVMGALWAGSPAQAKKKGCAKIKPAVPISDSASRDTAPDEPIQAVTDKYTEAKPLVIEYAHGPAAWFIADPLQEQGQRAAVEDTKWFNLQLATKKDVGLYVRQEWAATPVSDMDLYVYDRYGNQVGTSGDFNQVQGTPVNSGTGGAGFEQISGMLTMKCDVYTVESRAFTSPGEAMTLKVWVGPVQ